MIVLCDENDALRARLDAADRDTETLRWLNDRWMDGIHVEVSSGPGDIHSAERRATLYTGSKGEWTGETIQDAVARARSSDGAAT